MGCCCSKRVEEKEAEDDVYNAATTSQLISDASSEDESAGMGQTVSTVKNRVKELFHSPQNSVSPEPVIVEAPPTHHEEPASPSGLSSLSANAPTYPLATPRSPLRRTRPPTPSESPSKPPHKRLKEDVQFMDYPILQDETTIRYIQKSKVMMIMKGLPGSGKSSLVENITKVYEKAVVCSADLYFMVDGVYQFDFKKLKDAHEFSQESAREAAENDVGVIIIDNTNVRNWEMKVYLDLATEYNYVQLVLEPQTPWRFDAAELAKRNSHGVDEDIIAKKVKAYQPVSPIYFGWFLNDVDSQALTKICLQWFQSVLDVKDFFEDFSLHTQLFSRKDMLRYFGLDSFVNGGRILHVTSKFTARGKADGGKDYINSQLVKSVMGRSFTVNVIGFIISPRTFGARVKLSPDQLELWGADDNEIRPPTGAWSPDQNMSNNSRYTDDNQDENLSNEMSQEFEDLKINLDSPGSSRVTVQHLPQETPAEDRFNPTSGKGSRAHLTMGYAQGVKPVTTGFDMINVVSYEQNVKQIKESNSNEVENYVRTYDIPEGILRNYGDGTWVIYPDKRIVLQCIFSAFY